MVGPTDLSNGGGRQLGQAGGRFPAFCIQVIHDIADRSPHVDVDVSEAGIDGAQDALVAVQAIQLRPHAQKLPHFPPACAKASDCCCQIAMDWCSSLGLPMQAHTAAMWSQRMQDLHTQAGKTLCRCAEGKQCCLAGMSAQVALHKAAASSDTDDLHRMTSSNMHCAVNVGKTKMDFKGLAS